ncbi:MAG TPA: hypothetical protein VF042_15155 [Gemmatimonadaceae bacterium]
MNGPDVFTSDLPDLSGSGGSDLDILERLSVGTVFWGKIKNQNCGRTKTKDIVLSDGTWLSTKSDPPYPLNPPDVTGKRQVHSFAGRAGIYHNCFDSTGAFPAL